MDATRAGLAETKLGIHKHTFDPQGRQVRMAGLNHMPFYPRTEPTVHAIAEFLETIGCPD